MGLRIAPDLYSTLLYAVTTDRDQLNTDLQDLSTGKSVNQPSDNPAAEAAYIENQQQAAANDQYQQSISTVQGALGTADTALGSIVSSISQALSIGTEGANGTNSTSDLQALATQVQSIQTTVLGLANTAYQGNYLFGGTNVTAAPYVASGTAPSGVAYDGNTDTNTIQVGPGQFVTTNLPGSTIFNAAGADIFQGLHDLAKALQTNTNIPAALSELTSAYNNLNAQRSFYGNAADQLTAVNDNLSQEQLTLSTQQQNLIGANTATVSADLSQDETTLQAALQGFAAISQNNLLSYLKL